MITRQTARARFVAHHALCTLNLDHPDVAHAVLDPHDMHRLVMRAYRHWVPDGATDARAQMGVLHTYAVNLPANILTLVVQSRVPGNWSSLPTAALAAPPDLQTIDMTINQGAAFRFRAVVNPAVYAERRGTYRRDSQADSSPAAVQRWFTARQQPPSQTTNRGLPYIGATANPEQLTIRTLPTLATLSAHRGMRISRAEIQGELTVTDSHRFADTLTHGLGRARAYGCGLLLAKAIPAKTQKVPHERTGREASRPGVRG
ncbi:type I-E CRISPR-associated protein Cas6/Cse3/CasE [Streptomyces sp. N35]|uniref:type I-E CRISPR-associated protein Cas6/Cse3/CasE n=1 Tax=Streptomyces sp. N35 TaxID=2795730 RepID=UPI0018F2864F|nr:type I-E CRISPR-associated protein Cas6/Cse3/CasE [Streptomyces sp. N35]